MLFASTSDERQVFHAFAGWREGIGTSFWGPQAGPYLEGDWLMERKASASLDSYWLEVHGGDFVGARRVGQVYSPVVLDVVFNEKLLLLVFPHP